MRTPIGIIMLIAGLALALPCFSQLTADAGTDTAFCSYNWEEASIGGNPSAQGGTEPYTYAWSAAYAYGGHIYSASTLLADTTVANPVFTGPFQDSAMFRLTVTDANQETAMDSVWVRFSNFIMCTADCFYVIDPGDSVQLGPCISGGIPPFQYAWTPGESLSDSTSLNPWAKPLSNTRYDLIYTDSIGCQAHWRCEVSVSQSGVNWDDTGSDPLQLYPNPTSGIVHISFSHTQGINSLLEFYTIEGKLVKEVRIHDPDMTIDLSDLGYGMFFYKWINSGKTAGTGKILVEQF